jgi:UDP-galactopyranose mutase
MKMDLQGLKYLVVGAGFFGSVIAERIAEELQERVVIIDKRSHIGGNAFSETDAETGIGYHTYGTHIFHTSKKNVWDYINRFTSFNGYRHQVLAVHKNKVYQMPINLETINSFYNVNLRPYEVAGFLQKEKEKEKIQNPSNLEEKAVSLIGRPLYEAFIKGYTMKQWEKDPKELPVSIIDRLPVRTNYNENYFFDMWQGIPLDGYGRIFEKLLLNRDIDLMLNVDFFEIRDRLPEDCLVIYSGPIDRFFDYRYGRLAWRSLDFEKEVIRVEDYQGTSVMNYPEVHVPFVRIHEPRHLHAERDYTKEKTLIIREYPRMDNGDHPYYPVNTRENEQILRLYEIEAGKQKKVIFGGRLGDYRYYDMDQVIASALEKFKTYIKRTGGRDGWS